MLLEQMAQRGRREVPAEQLVQQALASPVQPGLPGVSVRRALPARVQLERRVIKAPRDLTGQPEPLARE